MPMPDRTYEPGLGYGESTELTAMRRAAIDALTDASLAHMVDFIAYADEGSVVVENADGASRIDPSRPEEPAAVLRGRDPVADRDPLKFVGVEAELADQAPPNARHAYPLAGTRLLSQFADPRAPDIAIVHTGKHYWPDRGGHIGEHGSLNVVQSRAPFVLSGAGVHQRGVLNSFARVVDVGPTLGRLAGLSSDAVAGLDGVARTELVEPGAASYVVGLLWDGANCNSLLDLAAGGELPAVARLLERGCALAGGAIAEFPSNTLCNHTAALTGVGPGRHGIVNNCYWDRAEHRQVLANESGTWHVAMDLLRDGVPTVFELTGGERTACINEPVDRGAAYSTFDLIRNSGHSDGAKSMGSMLPDPAEDPCATHEFTATDKDYRWSSQVDAAGLAQILDLWKTPSEAPRLTWWNTTLTDTGHHNGGPHSDKAQATLRDADRRLGLFLDRLDALGVYDDTVILLTADHGSERADESCLGDWDDALRAEGIPFRDEAIGWIYLGA